jgi:hypothetical protein
LTYERVVSVPGDIARLIEGQLTAFPLQECEGASVVMRALPDVIYPPDDVCYATGCRREQRPKGVFRVSMPCPRCGAKGEKCGLVLEGCQVMECLSCKMFLWAERFVKEEASEAE